MILFPPWYGELGWEVMVWAPRCRLQADGRACTVTSFVGMDALYGDFATFCSHDRVSRNDGEFPVAYRSPTLHKRYGNPNKRCSVLIHARGITRKRHYNYTRWAELSRDLPESCAVIGSKDDAAIATCEDLRGLPLQDLMDIIAGARVVVGVSSGVMHLAAACGTDVVAWGYSKTHFGETLEKRYKETWNPHGVRVEWITAEDWQPEPRRITKAIERML